MRECYAMQTDPELRRKLFDIPNVMRVIKIIYKIGMTEQPTAPCDALR